MEAVDSFPYTVGRIGLGQTLCDGWLSVACHRQVAGRAKHCWSWCIGWSKMTGEASESYHGVLAVAGVRYSSAGSLFADLDGAHFIANIASFEPVGWRAG